MAVYAKLCRPAAGQQCAARRRTDRAALVILREERTFARETVEGGRLELPVAVTRQVAPAEVIGENE